MTKRYIRPVNIGDSEKRILKNYRLKASVIAEIERLSEASGMDMTEIIEIGVLNVRPIIEKMVGCRLEAVRRLIPDQTRFPMLNDKSTNSAREHSEDNPAGQGYPSLKPAEAQKLIEAAERTAAKEAQSSAGKPTQPAGDQWGKARKRGSSKTK